MRRPLVVPVLVVVLAACSAQAPAQVQPVSGASSPTSSPSVASPSPSPTAPAIMQSPVAASPAGRTQTLRVFFNRMDEGAVDCATVEAVERRVPPTRAVATAALNELFAGPTPAERRRGLTSLFDERTSGLLRSIRVEDRIAYLDLHRSLLQVNGASTSCGSSALLASISRTLEQFPTVDEVRYAVEGDPQRFYDFVQIGCPMPPQPGDRCDMGPFT